MKIGINALGLKPASAGGVEIYFRNLVKNICEFNTDNEFYIFLDSESIRKAVQPYAGPRLKLVYFHKIYIYSAYALSMLFTRPGICYKLVINKLCEALGHQDVFDLQPVGTYGYVINLDRFKLDVLHFPFSTINSSFFDLQTPIALTIHDIQQEYYPEFFDAPTLISRRQTYRPSAERADIIITISEATRKSLVEKYHLEPEKIVVTHQGCSKDFRRIDDSQKLKAVREKYSLPEDFMLYPASTWPHKNHLKMLEAMCILRDRYSFKKKLILTGIPMNNHKLIVDAIDNFHLADYVKFLGFVPFGELPVIYNLATIMVFPSLFEGFGIPLLEAMNAGLPIACSDRTSIPEIVGAAGLYFNPDNAGDMAEKIYRLCQDDALKEKLADEGFKQAKKFIWEEAFEKTVSAYWRSANKLASQQSGDKMLPKFAADVMLGKLAKWLRILGYDTAYDSRISDEQLVELARREERIILTRDTRLVMRRSARPYVLIAHDYAADQLRQLVRELNLSPGPGLLSRCLVCNEPLSQISAGDAEGHVPPYVFNTQSRFYQCPTCRRIFWPATHVKNILQRLSHIMQNEFNSLG